MRTCFYSLFIWMLSSLSCLGTPISKNVGAREMRVLQHLVKGGEVENLKKFLEGKDKGKWTAFLRDHDENGFSLIHTASHHGQLEVLKYFKGLYPTIFPDDGNSFFYQSTTRLQNAPAYRIEENSLTSFLLRGEIVHSLRQESEDNAPHIFLQQPAMVWVQETPLVLAIMQKQEAVALYLLENFNPVTMVAASKMRWIVPPMVRHRFVGNPKGLEQAGIAPVLWVAANQHMVDTLSWLVNHFRNEIPDLYSHSRNPRHHNAQDFLSIISPPGFFHETVSEAKYQNEKKILHTAIQDQDIEKVISIAKANPKIVVDPDENGFSVAHTAVYYGKNENLSKIKETLPHLSLYGRATSPVSYSAISNKFVNYSPLGLAIYRDNQQAADYILRTFSNHLAQASQPSNERRQTNYQDLGSEFSYLTSVSYPSLSSKDAQWPSQATQLLSEFSNLISQIQESTPNALWSSQATQLISQASELIPQAPNLNTQWISQTAQWIFLATQYLSQYVSQLNPLTYAWTPQAWSPMDSSPFNMHSQIPLHSSPFVRSPTDLPFPQTNPPTFRVRPMLPLAAAQQSISLDSLPSLPSPPLSPQNSAGRDQPTITMRPAPQTNAPRALGLPAMAVQPTPKMVFQPECAQQHARNSSIVSQAPQHVVYPSGFQSLNQNRQPPFTQTLFTHAQELDLKISKLYSLVSQLCPAGTKSCQAINLFNTAMAAFFYQTRLLQSQVPINAFINSLGEAPHQLAHQLATKHMWSTLETLINIFSETDAVYTTVRPENGNFLHAIAASGFRLSKLPESLKRVIKKSAFELKDISGRTPEELEIHNLNTPSMKAIHSAIAAGDDKEVEEFLENFTEQNNDLINSHHPNGFGLVHTAAYYGQTEILKMFRVKNNRFKLFNFLEKTTQEDETVTQIRTALAKMLSPELQQKTTPEGTPLPIHENSEMREQLHNALEGLFVKTEQSTENTIEELEKKDETGERAARDLLNNPEKDSPQEESTPSHRTTTSLLELGTHLQRISSLGNQFFTESHLEEEKEEVQWGKIYETPLMVAILNQQEFTALYLLSCHAEDLKAHLPTEPLSFKHLKWAAQGHLWTVVKELLYKLAEQSPEEIYATDSEGKNFLHLIAQSGFYLSELPKDLLAQIDPLAFRARDNEGKTPCDLEIPRTFYED